MSNESLRADSFRYECQDMDGRNQLLLDTMALYENHSGLPMHEAYDTRDGVVFDYVIDRLVRNLMGTLGEVKSGQFYSLVLLASVRRLLEKYRPMKFLWISRHYHPWMKEWSALMRRFHEDSKFYWLTEKATTEDTGIITWQMPFDDLLLPRQTFDFLVLDELSNNMTENFSDSLIVESRLSLRYQGEWFICTGNQTRKKLFSSTLDARFFKLGTQQYIFEGRQDRDGWTRLQENTYAYAVENIKQEVQHGLQQLGHQLQLPAEEYDENIQQVRNLEEYIRLIYPYLLFEDSKYHINELKRVMIDYRLGYGSYEEVCRSYHEMMQEDLS